MSQTLGSLPNKSKVKFGKLFGAPIIWQVGDRNHTGYPDNSTSLISRDILILACFDAKESANSDSRRKSYGNNRYKYSNVRQWLNSTAAPGSWYTAQHSADAPPSSANVWSNYNPYDTKAGFLNAFTQQERDALLSTTHTVGKASVDGGGTETVTDKIFLLSCTEVGLSGDATCGTKWAIFSDNASRVAKPTSQCVANSTYTNSSFNVNSGWYYWLADAYASYSNYARLVDTGGSLHWGGAYGGSRGVRPACNLSSSILVSDTTDSDGCYTLVYNQPPTTPKTITIPDTITGGQNAAISWSSSTDPEGNAITYKLEQKVDGGAWSSIYSGTSRSYSAPTKLGWKTVQYRVKAVDAKGGESAYTTSASRTVVNNRPPEISGTDTNLGTFSNAAPTYQYTVTDADGDQVTIKEYVDGAIKHTFTATLGQANEIKFTADEWVKISNGQHTIKITATDTHAETVTRTVKFIKAVTSIVGEQTLSMQADEMPTKALVNIQGSFPAGSSLTVEICNNGNDAAPTWENITSKVLSGQKHFFANTKKTAGSWGVKVRVTLLRGSATVECYITSIGGNFG